jgi:hypothetical protein
MDRFLSQNFVRQQLFLGGWARIARPAAIYLRGISLESVDAILLQLFGAYRITPLSNAQIVESNAHDLAQRHRPQNRNALARCAGLPSGSPGGAIH